jgi:cysteine desulfurase
VRIYADHAATTPLRDEVRAAMEPFERDRFGNPSEPHWAGRAARAGLDAARRRVADLLGCAPDLVIFTGGGSEADNLAVLGRARAGNGRVVASPVEHPAVREPLRRQAAAGTDVQWAPVDEDGVIDLDGWAGLVRPGDSMAAAIWGQNVTGVLQPVESLAQVCAERAVPLHLDAVQAAPAHMLELARLPGEITVAVAGHKMGGPRGMGALAGPGVATLLPVLLGGGQERGLRPGTENVGAAAGLAAALELAPQDASRVEPLRDAYEARLRTLDPSARMLGAAAPRLPGHSLAILPGVRGDAMVDLLDEDGIAVAAGSACASTDPEPSHVLAAMGLDVDEARGALRISLGALTTGEHPAVIAESVARAAAALRAAVIPA